MRETPTKYPENVPGIFFVNSDCIECDLCRETAPKNFRRKEPEGYFYVFKQPETPAEEALCRESMSGCPVDAIWNNGDSVDRSEERNKDIKNGFCADEAAHAAMTEAIASQKTDHKEIKVDPADDEDRVDCPFCGKMHYPGSGTAEAEEWTWDNDCVCEHLVFLALDLSGFSGFQYRSKLFNEHLSLPDSDDSTVLIPSSDDPEDFLSVAEIIKKISLPGLELRSYGDCRSDITFGFVPQKAN
jgi:ferredoxin